MFLKKNEGVENITLQTDTDKNEGVQILLFKQILIKMKLVNLILAVIRLK